MSPTNTKGDRRGRPFLTGLALVLLVAGFAWAGAAMSENYAEIKQEDGGVPTFIITAEEGDDSTTWSPTTPQTGRCFFTRGDGTLEITPRLSANNATVCVAVCKRDRSNGLHGVALVQTATSLGGNVAVFDGTGYYAEPLFFPLVGWAKYEIRVYDVSGSNTADLKAVMAGASGTAAE